MACNDKIRDKVTSTTNDDDMFRFRGQMEECIVKCGEDHIALVPEMMKRLKDVLENHSKS